MKEYKEPEFSIIELEQVAIITTSLDDKLEDTVEDGWTKYY